MDAVARAHRLIAFRSSSNPEQGSDLSDALETPIYILPTNRFCSSWQLFVAVFSVAAGRRRWNATKCPVGVLKATADPIVLVGEFHQQR